MKLSEIHKQIKAKKLRMCNKCGELKPVSEFHIKKGKTENQYRFNSPCKKCGVKQKNNSNQRDWSLKKKYNIDEHQYTTLLQEQNHSCKICSTHIDDFARNLAVDHCHKTGKVRGLLCTNCNLGLGNFKDDVNLLSAAIDYLN